MSQSRSETRESLVYLFSKDLGVHERSIRPKALVATVSMAELFMGPEDHSAWQISYGAPFPNSLVEAMRPDQVSQRFVCTSLENV